MEYKLAKRLKDAGFPQLYKKGDVLEGEDCERCGHHVAYAPTLEELIEACGHIGFSLANVHNDIENWWIASNGIENGDGENPTEAVAELWLATIPSSNAS